MKPGDFAENEQRYTGNENRRRRGSVLAWRDRNNVHRYFPSKQYPYRKHYGVTIKLKMLRWAINQWKIIFVRDNLNVMLQSLEAAFGLKATRQDDVVTITGS